LFKQMLRKSQTEAQRAAAWQQLQPGGDPRVSTAHQSIWCIQILWWLNLTRRV
jgi:hypothetical protein